MHFGGLAGDPEYELLERAVFEQRLGVALSASLVVATPELQRGLPLENLSPDNVPDALRPPEAQLEDLANAIRGGHTPIDSFYIAPDAHGGHGLFAATDLPRHMLLGEYVGHVRRETVACDYQSDAYLMRYPDVAGSLHLSAKDCGSLMRFVNHAPAAHPANNATCWAVLVDGAYHTVVVTSRAVRAREEVAYDYGEAYWASRGVPAL